MFSFPLQRPFPPLLCRHLHHTLSATRLNIRIRKMTIQQSSSSPSSPRLLHRSRCHCCRRSQLQQPRASCRRHPVAVAAHTITILIHDHLIQAKIKYIFAFPNFIQPPPTISVHTVTEMKQRHARCSPPSPSPPAALPALPPLPLPSRLPLSSSR
jgi:hypothetical protein